MVTILTDFKAETRSRIERDIPKIMKCLRDGSGARQAALNAFNGLLQYRESRYNRRFTILTNYQAETRSGIERDIPKVIACLGDGGSEIRQAALTAFNGILQYRESR
jgi:hypothetical protein